MPYLFERKQFGQFIGDFQGVQHQYSMVGGWWWWWWWWKRWRWWRRRREEACSAPFFAYECLLGGCRDDDHVVEGNG